MDPENFGRIIRSMRPAANRVDAEAGLIRAMREERNEGTDESREALLGAGGAFYCRYSRYALDNAGTGQAYTSLLNAWVDMGIGYDRGAKGEDFAELAFEMYRVIVTYRIHVDF